jgi:hypothetical protein
MYLTTLHTIASCFLSKKIQSASTFYECLSRTYGSKYMQTTSLPKLAGTVACSRIRIGNEKIPSPAG